MPSFRSLEPPQGPHRATCSEGVLRPLAWQPGHGPVAPPRSEPEAPPLLLLLDRRQPIDAERRQRLAASLSSAEQQRLEAMRRADDRERFLLGRGGLRLLLAAWLQRAPRAVPLELGPHGKPHCPAGPPFNLSHAGELILLALHGSRAVGVDVEQRRTSLDWRAVARRMLTEADQQELAALSEAAGGDAFLATWCRLEARLKARGTGLVGLRALQRQDELLREARRKRAGAWAADAPELRLDGGPALEERLWDVEVPDGYRAAVALAPLGAD